MLKETMATAALPPDEDSGEDSEEDLRTKDSPGKDEPEDKGLPD